MFYYYDNGSYIASDVELEELTTISKEMYDNFIEEQRKKAEEIEP